MNKKGVAILILSAVGLFVAIILFYSHANLPGSQEKYLGEAEIVVFNTYISAEKELLYIDLMAEYALQDSQYSQGELLKNFKKNFATRLNKFNNVYGRNLVMSDYEFKLSDDSIIGISSKQLNLSTSNIEYKFKPNFRVSIKN